ncbi:MAG: tyrosine-protein phosphatase [Candidatus Nanopelagicales bacterium]
MVFWDLLHGTRTYRYPTVPQLRKVIELRDPIGLASKRPGRLYRSAKLSEATYFDRLTLSGLLKNGLILDLRTPNRVAKEPDPTLPDVFITVLSLPPTSYVPYETVVTEHKEQLRRVLSQIAYWLHFNQGPVLVHCTEGKDRTGIIIGLVMLALGISEPVARKEFLATERADASHWNRMIQAMCWEIGHPDPRLWLLHRSGLNLDQDIYDSLREELL